MKTFAAVNIAWLGVVLCSYCCRSSFAQQQQQQQQQQPQAVAADQPAIDPSLDLLADNTGKDDDRSKRQLSFVQNRLLNLLKPLPVVDVAREEDKYGNDGDKFNRVGRSFIGGVEKVSSMLTSMLSFPVDSAKKLSRSATEMLNNLGGRLVGLQR